ncbi:MAG: sulfatase-like hydrolase/transferase [Verrucomicrobia bacterium]|nr:sulfatase-like hydrolase/transferase [Verrucomicrobiota bacterium]
MTGEAMNRQEDGVPSKTSFVQILTDDQGWGDLGCFGHPHLQTPHLDQLAAEGMKFTQCYAADSVCSPSRAAILTGRTPYRNGVYRWIPQSHFCHLPKDEVTLPQLLRGGGYQTAHFGKWHLSHYAEDRIEGSKHEFENFKYGGELVGQPSMDDYGYDYWFASGNVARPDHENPKNFFLNGEAMGEMKGFSAQLVAEQFVKWFNEERDKDQPFFVSVWFQEPHGPTNSDPEYLQRYEDLDDPSLRQYLGNVTQIDEAVGRIVETLKKHGLYDDTMLWYTSDNGPEGPHEHGTFNKTDSPYDGSRYRGSTGGLRGRKRHTHDGGIRVPGIVSWPKGLREARIKPGTVCAEPVVGSDLFPTTLEVAGIPVPTDRALDAVSLMPILRNEPFTRSRPMYWRNTFHFYQVALRDGDWKILANSALTEFALHNMAADPRETTDVKAHYPEIFERMKDAMIAYDKEVLAEGPDWWKRETAAHLKMPEPM